MRLSGLTYEPLTLDRGAASWMASLAATRVSRSALQGNDSEPPTRATYGRTSSESFASPDPAGASLRTWLDTFGSDTSTLFGPTLSALATGSRRFSYRRRTSARRTSDSGYSSSLWPTEDVWQTPTGSMIGSRRQMTDQKRGEWADEREDLLPMQAANWPTPMAADGDRTSEEHQRGNPTLEGSANRWPTPTAEDSEQSQRRRPTDRTLPTEAREFWPTPTVGNVTGGNATRGGERSDELLLPGMAERWTTPQAHDASGGEPSRVRRYGTTHGAANLADDVTAWPTPRASDQNQPGEHGQGGQDLRTATAQWATPKSRDWKGGQGSEPRHSPNLDEMAELSPIGGRPGPETSRDGDDSSPNVPTSLRRLNPTFVEALMGWPLGWTSLEPIDSASSGTA